MRRSYKRRTGFFGALRMPGLGFPCGLEPILHHPPVERSAAETKSLRRLTDISLRSLQCLADQNRFHGFEAEFFEILALRAQHVQSKVCALDLISAAHEDRAFERVLQFAHIARP